MRYRLTQGLVKEALFNILAQRVVGARFLDLYAGDGGVGLEALMRGAKEVVFVEIARSRVRNIQKEQKKIKEEEKIRIIQGDVLKILKGMELNFDIIFLDPPYNQGLVIPTLNLISQSNVSPSTIVVVEHHHKERLPSQTGPLRLTKERRYGETSLSFYSVCPYY